MSNNNNNETLQEAMDRLYATKWHHHRQGGKVTLSQAKQAVDTLRGIILEYRPFGSPIMVADPKPRDVREATAVWYKQGLSPATITKRLNLLGAMGVNVAGMRPPKDRKLKWWLTPEEKAKAKKHLIGDGKRYATTDKATWHHIQWTTLTGLRVEETLALTYDSFSQDLMAVNVPGTKTATAQATLALSPEAWEAGMDLMSTRWTDYEPLEAAWRKLREAMGWPDGATLKALRRSAARYLHVDRGMPLDMVRQYLRHEDIKTTMEYLRLTGGYRLDEMRRYLSAPCA